MTETMSFNCKLVIEYWRSSRLLQNPTKHITVGGPQNSAIYGLKLLKIL